MIIEGNAMANTPDKNESDDLPEVKKVTVTYEYGRQAEVKSEFAKRAEEAPPGLIAEFWDFLVHNKKWWLTPIIIVILLMGIIIFLGGTAAAPFIYPLF